MQRLTGKVAIVTGAGRGIGKAIAHRFSNEGATVVIAERDGKLGKESAASIQNETGNPVVCITTDISDTDSVSAMVKETSSLFGSVDILVNNAGIAVFKEPLDTAQDDWDLCMKVDLEGAWYCCKAVLPFMLEKRNGAIINIISNHAFSIIPKTFPYPVAKHALLGMTRSLALEYAGEGIAVNAISPGYTDTQIAQDEFNKSDNPDEERAKVEAKQPVGRLCKPEEVAAVAAMLASEEARFMIGENLVIDGGVTIRMYE
ncbi:SDR family oxidoreductase [Vibrio nigripulchritudo]|uniref:SDR family oxidoreductase n=1 Tax=Vibrio nigripulchritudo TaxID=28173 RepID=UPI0003B1FBAA|nr:SDR family oxidoreductase [Vibrio nigripulchritudo]CCN73651.1 putative 3-oxoacyl-(acyl-carrier-protein) reductase [Vibrio nigripulchritudo SFn118]